MEKQAKELASQKTLQKEPQNLQQQEEFRTNEEKFYSLIEMLPGLVFESDLKGKITFINKRGIKMLGYTAEELKTKIIWHLLVSPGFGNSKNDVQKLILKGKKYPQECYLIRKGRSQLPVEIYVSPIKNYKGKRIGFQGILLDITSRKEYEDKIKYLSFHDKLTGLYNRAYFEEELQRLSHSRNLPISIIIGDVNNLKMINDTFGHQHGDQLLTNIAAILKSGFRKSDIISRWGGDEFSVILPHTSKEKGIDIINRIKEVCRQKSTLTLPLSISMGIATKEHAPKNIYAVLREAEGEMYRQKILDRQVADSAIVESLAKALQQKKYETEEYRKNFIGCAIKFGNFLELEKKELDELKLLATICDIGKIALSEEIIFKKGWLNKEDWEEIKKHPEIGYRIARSTPELINIADAILHHHEFWDGKGYPHGIQGENIPLLSRVIHIVKAYQAMTSERPYRAALTKDKAIQELRKGQGSQFDPKLTDKFIAMIA
ncbi:MAG TPA: diguanylate cyclase [Atribacterota bacterium]|nr:diguanylate cyclase [Atribacterota bacterium]